MMTGFMKMTLMTPMKLKYPEPYLALCLAFITIVPVFSQKNQEGGKNYDQVAKTTVLPLKPIDPQLVQDQDDMTWNDYHPIPGKNWADPTLVPERRFRIALVAVDFPDQPFVITLPEKSDPFANPQTGPVKREDVPRFYSDFWITPSAINHGQTINGYWMEQSRGRFGISALDPYGPYRMPKNLWEYGCNEWGQNKSTPYGKPANGTMEDDVDSLWKADAGDLKDKYDAVLRIYAGYDETGVWQEFGEMKFLSREAIPAEWGNPDTTMPRWIPTRYVPWTSWKAGQMQWGLSSMRQGENSGTITHELGHYAFSIGDNNNNPYVKPYRRVGSGPWDMMDRGSFNGPGGPHKRWVVPAAMGAAMPAGLMLRNRMINGFIPENQVLTISRTNLANNGTVVANITARAVEPRPDEFAGIKVILDGTEPHDRTPFDDPALNPLSQGIPNFDFYSLETIQRTGYDSFCPDNGVLLAKNKEKESPNGGPNGFNCFNWVIDAHPEDINKVDFYKPDGAPVMRTIADYRQLNDALFHAGTNSGSEFEYEDGPNRLHFYIIDLMKDKSGILSYKVGVRSLDGPGPQTRGTVVKAPAVVKTRNNAAITYLTVLNTGSNNGGDPHDINDIYRISVSVEGEGWNAQLSNSLAAIAPGKSEKLPVYIFSGEKCKGPARVTVTARSENDPSKTASAVIVVKK